MDGGGWWWGGRLWWVVVFNPLQTLEDLKSGRAKFVLRKSLRMRFLMKRLKKNK
ncbi:hypothetical protein Hanom_Chr13g01198431 [Helianthus anomalus]